ncbi:MAG: hypothetical protein ACFCD0_16615 [Gemmataceae bacterium]
MFFHGRWMGIVKANDSIHAEMYDEITSDGEQDSGQPDNHPNKNCRAQYPAVDAETTTTQSGEFGEPPERVCGSGK